MCGIHGVIAPRGDCRPELERMHAALAHRGPDGEGFLLRDDIALGHRRLSIVDLTPSGAQPMWTAGGEACITYNGEIYNFRELRRECERRGLSFRSTSDTEVILNMYLLHGEQSFAMLNGMFAFCLFDARDGTAWLVRDRHGIKPMYFGSTARGIFFASELRALLASGVFALEIDPTALEAYLRLDYVPAPLSIVSGIEKLAGGGVLRVRNGVMEKRAFLSEPFDSGKAESSEQKVERGPVGEFDRAIHDAVSRQLVADVPVGVFLSGGVDSTIVAAVASELAGAQVPLFSMAFDDPSFDERPWFESVGRKLTAEHHIDLFTARMALDLVQDIPSIAGEPLGDASILPTYALSRFTRRHVKVALSGDGADELFGGYPTHRLWRIGSAYGRLPHSVRRAVAATADRLWPVSFDNLSLDYRAKKFLAGAAADPVIQNHQWLGTFTKDEVSKLLRRERDADEPIDQILRSAVATVPPGLERILRSDERFYLQEQVLTKTDRASMANSLEVRVPMLDDAVVGFAHALPPSAKVSGSTSKIVLRRWLAERFPPEISRRPKKGFGVPLGRWFRSELHDLLVESLARTSEVFDPAVVGRLIGEHRSGRRDNRKQLFNLLAFSLWYASAKSLQRSA